MLVVGFGVVVLGAVQTKVARACQLGENRVQSHMQRATAYSALCQLPLHPELAQKCALAEDHPRVAATRPRLHV